MAALDRLKEIHSRSLAVFGVEMPAENSLLAKILCCLYEMRGRLVALEKLRTLVSAADPQPRQLKYMGWNVLVGGKSPDRMPAGMPYVKKGSARMAAAGDKIPNGFVCLWDPERPAERFERKKRSVPGPAGRVWEEMKKDCGGVCLVCGREGEALERGHLNPLLPLDEENCAPMCPSCNNWISNDLVIGRDGRPVAALSARFIKAGPDECARNVIAELLADGKYRAMAAAILEKESL